MTELNGASSAAAFAVNQMHAWQDVAGASIVAICDRDPGWLRIVGDRFGIGRRFHSDAAEMFADGGFDFVDIATTVQSHRALVEMAAAHKVPAICQASFAKTLDDAKAMVKVCADAGLPAMVARKLPLADADPGKAKKVLEAGTIGQPFWGRFSFEWTTMSSPASLSGGRRAFHHRGPRHPYARHRRYILGDVAALSAARSRSIPRIKGEDVATILLDHKNGATSIVDVSYASKLSTEPFPETLIELDGTEGSIRLSQGYKLEVTGKSGTEVSDVSPTLLSWASARGTISGKRLRHPATLGRAARRRQRTSTSGADNLKTFALVEAPRL